MYSKKKVLFSKIECKKTYVKNRMYNITQVDNVYLGNKKLWLKLGKSLIFHWNFSACLIQASLQLQIFLMNFKKSEAVTTLK